MNQDVALLVFCRLRTVREFWNFLAPIPAYRYGKCLGSRFMQSTFLSKEINEQHARLIMDP